MVDPITIASVGSSILGAAGGLFGGNKAKSEARQAANQQRISTFTQNLANWQYQRAQQSSDYDYGVAKTKLDFELARAVAIQDWRYTRGLNEAEYYMARAQADIDYNVTRAAQQRDYQLQLTLQAAEYRTQVRAYEQSERGYADTTQNLAATAKLAYDQANNRLAQERAAVQIASEQDRKGFYERARAAKVEIEQATLRYKQEAYERGLTGAAAQLEVNQKRQEFVAQRFSSILEGSKAAGEASASGRSGRSVGRLANQAMTASGRQVGALAASLGFAERELVRNMMSINSSSDVASRMIDLQISNIHGNINNEATLTNLSLAERDRSLRELTAQTNFAKRGAQLQAQGAMDSANQNRVLRPLNPVHVPAPTPIARSLVPQPFQPARPLQSTRAFKPMLPGRPLEAPRPQLGAQVPSAGGSNVSGWLNAASSILGAVGQWNSFKAPSAFS